MKKRIVLPLQLIVLVVILSLSCKKSSGDENCKTCKVLGEDNSVIHEEKVCSEAQAKDLRSRFPAKEIVCQ